MGKLNQIFKNIQEIEPPRGLSELILKRVELEKDKQIKRKLFLSYAGFCSSVAATFYAFLAFGSSFLKSDFWSMLSLMFSDLMIVAGNWKTYLYSLVETFPVVNVIAILIPIFGLLAFLNLLVSIKNNKHISRHANLQFQH